MSITDTASGASLSGFNPRKLVKALAGGLSAYALSGLTLFSIASLAFLEMSLVLNVFMAGVALVVLCSIINMSLQDQEKANYPGQKSLPKLDKPSLKARSSEADLPQLQIVDTADKRVSHLEFADDCKSTKKSILVCALPTNDPIHSEFNAPRSVSAKVGALEDSTQETTFTSNPNTSNVTPLPGISIDKQLSLDTKPDAQAKNARTVFANAPPLLPEIVLKTTSREAFAKTSNPVVKSMPKECISKIPTIVPVTSESSVDSQPDAQVKHPETVFAKGPPLLPENVLKDPALQALAPTNNSIAKDTTFENTPKAWKKRDIFKSQGEIHFLHQTKTWGRIRLSKPTKWGENQVFFHRDHVVGNKNILLFNAQSVNVEYFYRRNNKGKSDSLRALRVEVITPSPPFTRQHKRSLNKPRELMSWRSRSVRRCQHPSSRAPAARSMRVAKGPSPDGSRGFQFRRTVAI